MQNGHSALRVALEPLQPPFAHSNCSASFAVEVCACPRIGSSACQKILLLRYGGVPVAGVVVAGA